MAFENVFGNVNYGMIAAARQQEANALQEAIGRGLAMAERAQERELRRRQLELKNATDYKTMGEQAIMQRLMVEKGYSLPEAAAALYNARNQTAPVRNAYGDVIGQGTDIYSALGLGQAAPVVSTLDGGQTSPGMSLPGAGQPTMAVDDIGLSGMGAQRAQAMAQQGDVTQVKPVLTKEQFEEAKTAPQKPKPTELPDAFKNTRLGAKMKYDQMAKFDEKQWEASLKTAQDELKTKKGQASVNVILNRMSELNDELNKRGAIMSGDAPLKKNIERYFLTRTAGQEARKILDPETQAYADEYMNLQSTLLPYYASAAGLGAKSLDSEGERKSILASFGSPAGIYEANQRQIDNLRSILGGQSVSTMVRQENSPVQVQSPDDYNKLGSGQQYIDPNGVLRTKK